MRGSLSIAIALLALAFAACTSAATQSGGARHGTGATIGGDRTAGARIFAANCASCHGNGGEGGSIGPSLREESRRMAYGALVSWIKDPQPPMPHLYPQILSEAQVRDVASYVESL
jgi:mono/diheme cytochrome c family protein